MVGSKVDPFIPEIVKYQHRIWGVILDTLARACLRIVHLGWSRGVECRDKYTGPIVFFWACHVSCEDDGLVYLRAGDFHCLVFKKMEDEVTPRLKMILYRSPDRSFRIIHPKCVICVHILFISQVCIYNAALIWGPYVSSITEISINYSLSSLCYLALFRSEGRSGKDHPIKLQCVFQTQT